MRHPPRSPWILVALAAWALAVAGCTTSFDLTHRGCDDCALDATVDASDAVDAPAADVVECTHPGDRCCTDATRGAFCTGGPVCSEGFCAPCPGALFACGNACVDIQTNGRHCGACDVVCAAGTACVAGSCMLDCPAPSTVCGQACVNLQSDPANCGSCGQSCAGAADLHTTGLCRAGACERTCADGYGDCDDNPANGCEVDLLHSAAHCGACGQVCSPARATGACVAGACTVGGCNAGYANCDGVVGNGCEVDANHDPAHCHECATMCAAGQSCSAGVCVTAVACSAGHADCDPMVGGCETSIANDVSNCGACGRLCAFSHASATCAAGVCARGACNAGYADCDGDATNGCETNTATATAHCGSCARACTADHGVAACVTGACAVQSCSGAFADCDGNASNGCEVDTATSAPDCGGCMQVCAPPNAAGACVGGRCGVGACNAGFADCDGNATNGCEVNLAADPLNCGTCTNYCAFPNATAATCAAGACALGACLAGYANCDAVAANGCETNVNGDAASCGACGHICSFANAVATCAAGACVLAACADGWGSCDNDPANGCETLLASSNANCGACGTACPPGRSCSNGACVTTCPAGQVLCAGACVNTNTNVNNCGGCGTVCPAGANEVAVCTAGACRHPCVPPYGNCDANPTNGCETSLNTSAANCGACGTACPSPPHATGVCTAGRCGLSCESGYADCDGAPANGCEATLATDGNNCGACMRRCPASGAMHVASGTCSGGTCQLTCATGFGDCDRDASNGCEVALDSASHCGSCETVCPMSTITSMTPVCCMVAGTPTCCQQRDGVAVCGVGVMGAMMCR